MRVLPHAVAQGIGWGLLERRSYDDTGRLVSGTLMDEPPVVAAGAAIANVVAHATVCA